MLLILIFFVFLIFLFYFQDVKRRPFKKPLYSIHKKSSSSLRVAIIGAGPSGLTSIKACLEESIEPVCFEQGPDLGGLWRYTDHESHSSVMSSTILNSSREMTSYSDFPIPETFSIFLHQSKFFQYLQSYAQNFDLKKYIRFETFVNQILPIGETGRWKVIFTPKTQNKLEEEFDAVMVCSGHHWDPIFPNFKGQEKFKGKILHSHSYKKPEILKSQMKENGGQEKELDQQKILVVGCGNSGMDVAVELSRISKETYISVRNGGNWIISRLTLFGRPLDYGVTRVLNYFIPFWFIKLSFKIIFRLIWGNINDYGLSPSHDPFNSTILINSDFFGRVISGCLKVKPSIRELKEESVIFEDGTEVPIDAIILCTGYHWISSPFISDSLIPRKTSNFHPIYKFILPLKASYINQENQNEVIESPNSLTSDDVLIKNLAMIGYVQALGSIGPISEQQARWFVQYLIGNIQLPEAKDLFLSIQDKKDQIKQRFGNPEKFIAPVEFLSYVDELVEDFGGELKFWDLKKQYGMKFAVRWLTKIGSPVQYRLKGPHSWSDAQKYLKKIWNIQ